MFFGKKRLFLILSAVFCSLVMAAEEGLSTLLESDFSLKKDKIISWTPDEWCRDRLKITGDSSATVECPGEMATLMYAKTFPVKPGEILEGEFSGEGAARIGFGVYLYDRKGFIGVAEDPTGLVKRIGAEDVRKIRIAIPETLNKRIPTTARAVINVWKGCSMKFLRMKLSRKADFSVGRLSASAGGNALASIHWEGGESLVGPLWFSWLAKGEWRGDSTEAGNVSVEKKNMGIRFTGECADFLVEKEYTFLPSPEAVRIDFTLTAREDIFMGGGDVPGAITLPMIPFSSRLSHYLRVNADGSGTVLSKNDFEGYRTGFFESDFISGRCSPDGKEGVLVLLDNSVCSNREQSPFLTGIGLAWPQDAFRIWKKGEKCSARFFLIPFRGAPEETIRTALKAYAPANPEMRNSRYEKRLKTPPETFRKFADSTDFSLSAGWTELVLPEQVMPEETASLLRLSAAKNGSDCAQIALRPKRKMEKVTVRTEVSGGIESETDYLEFVPAHYAASSLGMRGEVPDILAGSSPRPVEPGRNHSWLIRFKVPADAEAGVHRGVVLLEENGKESARIPFELEVYDFSLPGTPFYKTAFLNWTNTEYAGVFDSEIYLRDLRNLRISTAKGVSIPCDAKGKISPENLAAAQQKVRAILDAGDTCWRLEDVFLWRNMPIQDKTSPEAEAYIKNYTRQVADAMREIGALDKVWFLMMDETHWGDEANNRHIKWASWVKETAPDLPIFSTQNHPLFPLAEKVDQICGSTASGKRLQEKFGAGKKYWLYENGFYFALGHDVTVPRSIPWCSIPMRVEGYHQWCVAWWGKNFRPGYFHGTSSLYYPPSVRGEKPVRSFRLVNFAQGMEDYDYIRILEQKIANSGDVEAGKRLSSILSGIVDSDGAFHAGTAELRKCRDEIARMIVASRKMVK